MAVSWTPPAVISPCQKMTKCSLPLRFLLWIQPLTPVSGPRLFTKNWVKGVHGVLERVCFVTVCESEWERKRERAWKVLCNSQWLEVDSLNSEQKEKELRSSMSDYSLSNTNGSILIYFDFCCVALLNTYKEPYVLWSDRAYLVTERKIAIKQQTDLRGGRF